MTLDVSWQHTARLLVGTVYLGKHAASPQHPQVVTLAARRATVQEPGLPTRWSFGWPYGPLQPQLHQGQQPDNPYNKTRAALQAPGFRVPNGPAQWAQKSANHLGPGSSLLLLTSSAPSTRGQAGWGNNNNMEGSRTPAFSTNPVSGQG